MFPEMATMVHISSPGELNLNSNNNKGIYFQGFIPLFTHLHDHSEAHIPPETHTLVRAKAHSGAHSHSGAHNHFGTYTNSWALAHSSVLYSQSTGYLIANCVK